MTAEALAWFFFGGCLALSAILYAVVRLHREEREKDNQR